VIRVFLIFDRPLLAVLVGDRVRKIADILDGLPVRGRCALGGHDARAHAVNPDGDILLLDIVEADQPEPAERLAHDHALKLLQDKAAAHDLAAVTGPLRFLRRGVGSRPHSNGDVPGAGPLVEQSMLFTNLPVAGVGGHHGLHRIVLGRGRLLGPDRQAERQQDQDDTVKTGTADEGFHVVLQISGFNRVQRLMV